MQPGQDRRKYLYFFLRPCAGNRSDCLQIHLIPLPGNSPNKAYHLIQAFAPGVVSFEETHQIGKELTEIIKYAEQHKANKAYAGAGGHPAHSLHFISIPF